MSTKQMFEHKIHLTKQMKDRLQSGGMVRIRHSAINHAKGKAMRVLEGNHQRLLGAYQNKKMAEVQLDPEEIKENDEQGGTGFFRTLHKMGVSKKKFNRVGKKIVKGLKTVGIEVAKEALPVLAQVATTAGVTMASENPLAGAVAGKVASNLVKTQVKKLGSGIKMKSGCGFDKKLFSKINRGATVIKHQFGGSINPGPNVTTQYDATNIHSGLLSVNNVLSNSHPARDPYIPQPQGTLVMTAGSGIYAPKGSGIYAPGR